MLKRCITGSCLIAVMVGFFFLRNIDVRFFNIIIGIFATVGTVEILRAFKSRIFKLKSDEDGKMSLCFADKILVTIIILAAVLVIPAYTFFGVMAAFSTLIAAIIFVLIIKIIASENFKTEFWLSVLCVLYPNLLLLAMAYANSLTENSTLALLMIFVSSSLSDTCAYLVGSAIGGKKLCPKISPNKTVSGAIGGLLGGMLGGILLYFICKPTFSFGYGWLVMLAVGLVGALFTEIGDLFESGIKRFCGIKDMGKILPGHGGVLDRIDGIMFASAVMAIAFSLV